MRDKRLAIELFKPEHIRRLQPREFERRDLLFLGMETSLRLSQAYLHRGIAWTGLIDGEVLVCAGLFLVRRGVAHAWSLTTPLVNRYPKVFHRIITVYLDRLIANLRLQQVLTEVHRDHEVSQKWLRRLGFQPTGGEPLQAPDGGIYIPMIRVSPRKGRSS